MKIRVPISPISDVFETITVDDELVEKLHDFGTDPAIKVIIRNHMYSLASQKYLRKVRKKIEKEFMKYAASIKEEPN